MVKHNNARNTLFILLICSISSILLAEPVSIEQARKVADTFLKLQHVQQVKHIKLEAMEAEKTSVRQFTTMDVKSAPINFIAKGLEMPSININTDFQVLSPTTGPTPENYSPQLSNGYVEPASGSTDTGFYWYVDYYDPDGDPPSTKKVWIYDVSKSLGLYSGSAANGTYRYGPLFIGIMGTHNYYFDFTDGEGGSARLPTIGTYSGPTVTPGKAHLPSPADNTTDVSITADLSWSAGTGATSHDVYFGIDPSPGPDEFQGNTTETSFIPGEMVPVTTYYWRIDEVCPTGTTTGDVWSFTTVPLPPSKPINPRPSNGIMNQSVNVVLSWSDGGRATSYDVYFGTNPTPGIGEYKGEQSGTIYDPGVLTQSTTYYWRIDAKNAGGTTTGDVWSFTTAPAAIKNIQLDRIPALTSQNAFSLREMPIYGSATVSHQNLSVLVEVENQSDSQFYGSVKAQPWRSPTGTEYFSLSPPWAPVSIQPGESARVALHVGREAPLWPSEEGSWEVDLELKQGFSVIDRTQVAFEVISDNAATHEGPKEQGHVHFFGDALTEAEHAYYRAYKIMELVFLICDFAGGWCPPNPLDLSYAGYLQHKLAVKKALLDTASLTVSDNGVDQGEHSIHIEWRNRTTMANVYGDPWQYLVYVYYDRAFLSLKVPDFVQFVDAAQADFEFTDAGKKHLIWVVNRPDKLIKKLIPNGSFSVTFVEPSQSFEIEAALALMIGPFQGPMGSEAQSIEEEPLIYNYEKWNTSPDDVHWYVIGADSKKLIIAGEGVSDSDVDGLPDDWEIAHALADDNPDTEGDGMPDGWEVHYELEPLENDAQLDADNDGLANADEYNYTYTLGASQNKGDGTLGIWEDPNSLNPRDSDSEGDGMPDGWEVSYSLNPVADDAQDDADGDGYSNIYEYLGGSQPDDPNSLPPPVTTRVSVDSNGVEGNYGGWGASISADGRYVAFSSEASDLVRGDENNCRDIFVHDRQSGQTTRVSVSSSGVGGNNQSQYASISADGRYMAFASCADNLVPGDENNTCDVFVNDCQTGETKRISVDSNNIEANGNCYYGVSISGGGRYVAFSSEASNLVPHDCIPCQDVFVHDCQTGKTTLISVDSNGVGGNQHSFSGDRGSISADGRYVVFMSYARNLVPGDKNGTQDIFVHDRQTGQTRRVSVSSEGMEGNNWSKNPSISADGRYVAFLSSADNLVPGDDGACDVFVHDRQTGQTTRVSVDSNGVKGNGWVSSSISADGRYVAFDSRADNLVPGDENNTCDVFVHDRQTKQTMRISVDSSSVEGNNWSQYPSISADGRYVAFESYANNLVPGDENGWADVFVLDRGPTNLEDCIVPVLGDVDGSCFVDLLDFTILAGQWLNEPGQSPADIMPGWGDNFVDFLDLALLTDHWLQGTK